MVRLGEKVFDQVMATIQSVSGGYVTPRKGPAWIGREKNLYLAMAPFSFPTDLFGAHAVTILVPEEMEAPSGNPGHSRIRKLDKDALVPEIAEE